MNLDKLAYNFARRPNTITLIFNHASTAELKDYLKEKEVEGDPKFCQYYNDIIEVKDSDQNEIDDYFHQLIKGGKGRRQFSES